MTRIKVHHQTVQGVHPDTNEYFDCVSTQQAECAAWLKENR